MLIILVLKSFVNCTDPPFPFGVRAEATADNTSIRVSWQWSRQGVPMCVDLVRVNYQPEGGSLMSYIVGNTTATSATLLNLQCNTKYTVWVQARSAGTGRRSSSKMVSLPARGMYLRCCFLIQFTLVYHHAQPLPLPLMSLLS